MNCFISSAVTNSLATAAAVGRVTPSLLFLIKNSICSAVNCFISSAVTNSLATAVGRVVAATTTTASSAATSSPEETTTAVRARQSEIHFCTSCRLSTSFASTTTTAATTASTTCSILILSILLISSSSSVVGRPLQTAASKDPITECVQAEIAQGTAAKGFAAKCVVASNAPNAEFCMPTSMLFVRATRSGYPRALLNPYPSAKPPACSANTASSRRVPAVATASAFLAITLPQMMETSTTAESAAKGATFFTCLGNS